MQRLHQQQQQQQCAKQGTPGRVLRSSSVPAPALALIVDSFAAAAATAAAERPINSATTGILWHTTTTSSLSTIMKLSHSQCIETFT